MHRYPDYIFYGDAAVAQSAQVDKRYGTESLKGVLTDIHFLSLSDYLVCTFSSQVKFPLFHQFCFNQETISHLDLSCRL